MNTTWLYTISGYDFGNSAISIEKYVLRAKYLGYKAIGIADPTLLALPEFCSICNREGIKPITGYQIKLESNFGTKNAIVYILNETGYKNLCQIIALKKDGYFPEDLIPYKEGLILVIPSESFGLENLQREAEAIFPFNKVFKEIYIGLEIRTKEEQGKAKELRDFFTSHSYSCIAFPKCLYLEKKDKLLLDVLKANTDKEPLSPSDLKDPNGPDFLFAPKAFEEIYAPEDIAPLKEIADQISFDLLDKKRGELLSFTNSKEKDVSLFLELSRKAKDQKALTGKPAYEARFDKESKVIIQMGFASYFLIVSDYVKYAKSIGIKVGPGRGSACGCLIAFLLDITEIDPLKYDLSFERFLNPKRVTMPDIDMDFEDDRREEIVKYLTGKYGQEKVSQIITFSKYKVKSALKASGYALNIPQTRMSALLKAVPTHNINTIQEALQNSSYLRKLYGDAYYHKVVDLALAIEGLPVNTSIHAAGVIISKDSIYKECPVSNGKTGIALYEYPYLESMGFLKVDLLALHYLTLIRFIEERIVRNGGSIPDYQALQNDEKTYQTINALNLLFVFQLDGEGIKKAIREIHPNNFNELVALLALYRPGPMENIPIYAQRKRTNKVPSTGYPKLDAILKDTYGIILYQEQILKIAHEIASFDLGEADLLRRAISKKNLKKMESYKEDFLKGSMKNGLSEKDSKGIYDLILRFADYGFNKSHSVAYALITFTMAYLKTHFPKEFYSVISSEVPTSSQDFKRLISELKQIGIKTAPINILTSTLEDHFEGEEFILGFRRTKAVTDKIVEAILAQRNIKPYSSIGDFLSRISQQAPLDERTIVSLVDAGLLDPFHIPRSSLDENAKQLERFASFAIPGMDDMLPAFNTQAPTLLEIAKEFLRELAINGYSLNIDLKKYLPEIPVGYSYGIVSSEVRFSSIGRITTLSNKFGTLSFLLNTEKEIKLYDILIFKPSKVRRDLYAANDIRIIRNKEN